MSSTLTRLSALSGDVVGSLAKERKRGFRDAFFRQSVWIDKCLK